MRKLNSKEYFLEEDAFFKRYNEFLDKIAEINTAEDHDAETLIEGNGDGLHKWSQFKEKYSEKVQEYEDRRKKLIEEYEGYTNTYDADFYTSMTWEYLEDLRKWYEDHQGSVEGFWESSNAPLFYAEKKRFLGRKVRCESSIGILKDICVTPDDYYYLVDVDGKEEWITGVASIELYKEDQVDKEN
jgi:hypothetical protein